MVESKRTRLLTRTGVATFLLVPVLLFWYGTDRCLDLACIGPIANAFLHVVTAVSLLVLWRRSRRPIYPAMLAGAEFAMVYATLRSDFDFSPQFMIVAIPAGLVAGGLIGLSIERRARREPPASDSGPGGTPRLSGGQRFLLAQLVLLSMAVAVAALRKAFVSTLALFGDQPTVREEAIAGQALRIALWAIATPMCAWIVLRRGRQALLAAAAWLGLLAWASWWWWPTPPTDGFDTGRPLWLSSFLLVWSLVAAGLGIGLYAALRTRRLPLTVVAFGVVAATIALGAASHVNLLRHANDERPVSLPEGAAELDALAADPLWAALPGVRRESNEHAAARSLWGERLTTWKRLQLGKAVDRDLFRDAVAVAESAGWRLVTTSCFEGSWDAHLVKSFTVGQGKLRIAVASYLDGVSVFAEITDTRPGGTPGKCWGA